MLLRLKIKLAEQVNGLDLSHCNEGDVIEVADGDGEMLIAEGWAEKTSADELPMCHAKHVERSVAADDGYRGWRKAPPTAAGSEVRFHVRFAAAGRKQ
jgi:hypothetical protein